MTENPNAMESNANSSNGNTKEDSTDSSTSGDHQTTSSNSTTSTTDQSDQHNPNRQQNASQSLVTNGSSWNDGSSQQATHKLSPPKDLPLNHVPNIVAEDQLTKNTDGNELEQVDPHHSHVNNRKGRLPPPPEIAAQGVQQSFKSLQTVGNGNDANIPIDESCYNKLPHWSHNVTLYENVSVGKCTFDSK